MNGKNGKKNGKKIKHRLYFANKRYQTILKKNSRNQEKNSAEKDKQIERKNPE